MKLAGSLGSHIVVIALPPLTHDVWQSMLLSSFLQPFEREHYCEWRRGQLWLVEISIRPLKRQFCSVQRSTRHSFLKNHESRSRCSHTHVHVAVTPHSIVPDFQAFSGTLLFVVRFAWLSWAVPGVCPNWLPLGGGSLGSALPYPLHQQSGVPTTADERVLV